MRLVEGLTFMLGEHGFDDAARAARVSLALVPLGARPAHRDYIRFAAAITGDEVVFTAEYRGPPRGLYRIRLANLDAFDEVFFGGQVELLVNESATGLLS